MGIMKTHIIPKNHEIVSCKSFHERDRILKNTIKYNERIGRSTMQRLCSLSPLHVWHFGVISIAWLKCTTERSLTYDRPIAR